MRTIYYKNTWTVSSPYSDTPIMDIKVSNNLSTSIHCYTDDAGLEIKTQYVFVDPDKQLVVVMLSAQAKPLNRAPLDEHRFLRALSAYFPDSSHK